MPPLQRTRAMAGTGAEVEYRARLVFEFIEPSQQLAAHAVLQRSRRVVAGTGPIEGAGHRVAIDAEDLSRISQVHATTACVSALDNASTWASSCAADNVTRRRAVPWGTVGGRIAVTRKPCCSSCALSSSARAASPTMTGTMVVTGCEPVCASPRARLNRC